MGSAACEYEGSAAKQESEIRFHSESSNMIIAYSELAATAAVPPSSTFRHFGPAESHLRQLKVALPQGGARQFGSKGAALIRLKCTRESPRRPASSPYETARGAVFHVGLSGAALCKGGGFIPARKGSCLRTNDLVHTRATANKLRLCPHRNGTSQAFCG